MVAFRVVGAPEALQAIDFATIVLLFSMMVVVANLRIGGFFEHIAEWIVLRLHPTICCRPSSSRAACCRRSW
jgi:Na+/H+ antiporter NhaD/arsenite permease-like protein